MEHTSSCMDSGTCSAWDTGFDRTKNDEGNVMCGSQAVDVGDRSHDVWL